MCCVALSFYLLQIDREEINILVAVVTIPRLGIRSGALSKSAALHKVRDFKLQGTVDVVRHLFQAQLPFHCDLLTNSQSVHNDAHLFNSVFNAGLDGIRTVLWRLQQ